MKPIEKIELIEKSRCALVPSYVEKQKSDLKRKSFRRLAMSFGHDNIQPEDIESRDGLELLNFIKGLRQSKEVTPTIAEHDFLACMERFRVIGNRNIYGNACTVFFPPSGYQYNEEVSNTYYWMYDNALQSSEALLLFDKFIEMSADYVIGGGSKNMLEWIVEVGVTMAYEEWKLEQQNAEDVLDPTLTYLANQANQSAFTIAYIFG